MTMIEIGYAAEGFTLSRGGDITPPMTREESIDIINANWRELGLAAPMVH